MAIGQSSRAGARRIRSARFRHMPPTVTRRFPVRCWLSVAFALTAALLRADTDRGRLGAGIEWDDNVYRMATGPLASRESLVSSVTAQITGWSTADISTSYTFEAFAYSGALPENHQRHMADLRHHGRTAQLAWEASSNVVWINGTRDGLGYFSGHNSYATTIARERREQWQNRTSVSVQTTGSRGFLRGVGQFVGYDLRTHAGTLPSCDNYVDRSDLHGGLDLGHPISGGTVAIGYRRGRQFQDRDGGRTSDRSNDYHRIVLIIDWKRDELLRCTVVLGPEWHRYARDSTGPAKVDALFAETAVSWIFATRDTVAVSIRRSQTLASTGGTSYRDTAVSTTWRRKLSRQWSISAGARALGARYDGVVRNDWLLTGSLGLTRGIREHAELGLTCTRELGRDLSGLDDRSREFTRNVLNVQGSWHF